MSSSASLILRIRFGRILFCILVLLLLWWLLPSRAKQWTGDLAHDLRVEAENRFPDVSKASESFAKLSSELKDLPSSAFFAKDQKDQTKKMQHKLEEIKSLLLPREALSMVEEIDRLDKEIDAVRKSNGSDKATRLTNLKTKRRNAFRNLQTELRHIGLETQPVQDAAAAVLTAEARTLIDNAVVAKSAESIVEALRAHIQPETMNLEDARRYYGMYLAMIEVQLVCYDSYLEKGETEWLPELDRRESESEIRKAKFAEEAEQADISAERKEGFASLVRRESRIAATIQRQREGLHRRSDAIRKKHDKALDKADIARSAYEQINALSELLKLISEMDADYQSLAKLEIPTLDLFTDTQIFSELDAIGTGDALPEGDAAQ